MLPGHSFRARTGTTPQRSPRRATMPLGSPGEPHSKSPAWQKVARRPRLVIVVVVLCLVAGFQLFGAVSVRGTPRKTLDVTMNLPAVRVRPAEVLQRMTHHGSCKFEPGEAVEQPGAGHVGVALRGSPVSDSRPHGQFCHDNTTREESTPILTIVTATHNTSELIFETSHMLMGQSLSSVRWIIVSDHTEHPAALERLAWLDQHPGVRVVMNTGKRGLPAARNVGLALVESKYVSFLDDDDMLELTAYEKAVWCLESNPDLDMCSFNLVTHGSEHAAVRMGFHDGWEVYHNNRIAVSTVVRVAAIREGRVKYNEGLTQGMEDWDFWLQLIERGSWGYTIPEHLMWYRTRASAQREALWPSLFADAKAARLRMWNKHKGLKAGVPMKHPRADEVLEAATWEPPFTNDLQRETGGRHMLMVLPWLANGGVEHVMLKLLKLLAADGWKVTVVCTMYNPPISNELTPLFMHYTHDIFTLPTFLRVVDFPRFFAYLMRSRAVSVVLFSNCQMMYELLPLLRPQFPAVRYVDIVHSIVPGWRGGGYPWYSALNAPYLHLTLSVSKQLAEWVKARAASPTHTVPFYIGVPIPQLEGPLPRASSTSITMVARLDRDKRPLLAARAIAAAVAKTKAAAIGEFVGGGAMADQLASTISGLSNMEFRQHGSLGREGVSEVLRRSQLFILPSRIEGTSLAAAEAMAHGVPVIITDVGAMAEMAGNAAFRVLPCTHDPARDELALSQAIADFLELSLEEKQSWGARARARMEEVFDANKTLPGVVSLLELERVAAIRDAGAVPEPEVRPQPDAVMHYVMGAQLNEFRPYISLRAVSEREAGDRAGGAPVQMLVKDMEMQQDR